MDYKKEALKIHEKFKGKIEIKSKVKLKNRDDLSIAYTPGVAEPCLEIKKNKKNIYKYTIKGNSVAVVTDGSAVLGLGNIGAEASLPVMEGKALLFKEFADIDAYPICLNTQDVDEIVETVKRISPGFGGINLEDISAPRCFEVEDKLKKELDIPVFHDDQHGTAIVTLAALVNALKLVNKNKENVKIVISGAGAAGIAVAKMLVNYGFKDIVLGDSKGSIYYCKKDLAGYKKEIALLTNYPCKGKVKDIENCRLCVQGSLKDAMKDRDVFIGVSAKDIVTKEMIEGMNKDPIVFAMANPDPEISPELAKKAGAKIIATGRSDYPNQINNVLAFPGVFRGALDANATDINEEMKLAAALALSKYVKDLNPENIIPKALDKEVAKIVAEAVKEAAIKSGVIRN